DLDVEHVDSPGMIMLIEDRLDIVVDPVAFGQHGVEIVYAEHRAQRRLGELARRLLEILDLNDRFIRPADPVVDDRAYLDRDIVARDDVLNRHGKDTHPQIDPHRGLEQWDDEDEAGSFDPGEPAEGEDHIAFVLAQHRDAQICDAEKKDAGEPDDKAAVGAEHRNLPFGIAL